MLARQRWVKDQTLLSEVWSGFAPAPGGACPPGGDVGASRVGTVSPMPSSAGRRPADSLIAPGRGRGRAAVVRGWEPGTAPPTELSAQRPSCHRVDSGLQSGRGLWKLLAGVLWPGWLCQRQGPPLLGPGPAHLPPPRGSGDTEASNSRTGMGAATLGQRSRLVADGTEAWRIYVICLGLASPTAPGRPLEIVL